MNAIARDLLFVFQARSYKSFSPIARFQRLII